MTQLEKMTLKNVLCEDGTQKDVTVEIVPFNRRNDEHVDFAFAYSDMLGGLPSPFKSMSDVAVRAVELFMVHKEDDSFNTSSDYFIVRKDKRAARTLFGNPILQKAVFDFFENA